MKKFWALLLVLGVLLANPLGVFAESKISITENTSAKVDNGDGTLTKVYNVALKNTDTEATADFTKVEISFSYGSAITSFTCGDNGKFTATQDGGKCTFNASEENPANGAEFEVGKLTVVVKKNAADADCVIKYEYEGAEGKINPNTGASVPYIIITGGVVLAAGVYFATKKRTKLQRI